MVRSLNTAGGVISPGFFYSKNPFTSFSIF